MKEVFDIYVKDYLTAKRLANILYRPAIDEATWCSDEQWAITGGYIEVERDTEVFRIFER